MPPDSAVPAALPSSAALVPLLERMATALERLAPPPPAPVAWDAAEAYIWRPAPGNASGTCQPVAAMAHIPLARLQGIDHVRTLLLDNTRRFAAGLPANHALLWGARGMGKSSLVKAAVAHVNDDAATMRTPPPLVIVEIARQDIPTLPALLDLLRTLPPHRRCILFCDDLSFQDDDTTYKALKAALDGSLAGSPAQVLLYATSNQRHLMPRPMTDDLTHPTDQREEVLSLSDRFGLWLGFHGCDQATYLRMVDAYAAAANLPTPPAQLHAEALEWAATRGARSGRVAWQFMQDALGRAGIATASAPTPHP